jgi:hypothetical protein
MNTIKQNKQTAGQKGGLATLARYGPAHMRRIGQRGAARFWELYTTRPAGMSDFAIVKRETGEVIAFTSGRFSR